MSRHDPERSPGPADGPCPQGRRLRAVAWAGASVIALAAGFFTNSWRAAEPGFFRSFQRDTESLVIGRLVQSRQSGPLSVAGLPGAFIDGDLRRGWLGPEDVLRQYDAYLGEERLEGFSPYLSHPGGQGIGFSLLDRVAPGSPRDRLWTYRLLTSVLTAAVLAAIVLWLRLECGTGAALAALASLLAARWLAPFGHNLWWSPWALFLPMTAVAWGLRGSRRASEAPATAPVLAAIAGGAMLVKCGATGFEFVTAAIVMAMVPVVLVAVRDSWPIATSARRLAAIAGGAATAVTCAGGVLVLQVGVAAGDAGVGVAHLVHSGAKRMHGDPAGFEGPHATALEAGVAEVIDGALDAVFLSVRPIPARAEQTSGGVEIRFWHLVAGLVAATPVLLASGRRRPGGAVDRALAAAAWFALLGPLSWLLLFTAHAAVHPHLDPVVWHMPFTILAFAAGGRAAERLAAGRSSGRGVRSGLGSKE